MTCALTPNSRPTLNSAQVTTTLRKSRIRDFPLTPRLTPHSKLSTPSFTTMFQKPLIFEHVVLLSDLKTFLNNFNTCQYIKKTLHVRVLTIGTLSLTVGTPQSIGSDFLAVGTLSLTGSQPKTQNIS